MWLAQMAAADIQPVRLRTHSVVAAVTTGGLASLFALWVCWLSLGVSETLLLTALSLSIHITETHTWSPASLGMITNYKNFLSERIVSLFI